MANDTFHIGLCMAGAVSAGAYTAGVMDFLIQALDEWERARGDDNVPTHKVNFPVMGGASAGGMTSIITASAINQEITPIQKANQNILADRPENRLYHSWVDLTAEDMFPLLLKTDDIQGKVYSLINSNFIDEVAQRVVQVDASKWQQRPYFGDGMKVFTTLSNLQGFTFDFTFAGASDEVKKYFVSQHGDYACFELNANGTPGWIPLNFKDGTNSDLARNAAMATGAFPVGLRSRKIQRTGAAINENIWLKEILKLNPLEADELHQSLNVDGGVINNEPFVKIKEELDRITGNESGIDSDNFKNTVLMIDPFPSTMREKFDIEKDDMLSVISHTLGVMLAQSRIKPADLAHAWDVNNPSQYLIAPSRKVKVGGEEIKFQGADAIACGPLEGFGGFISKEFRIHDFFLGRANCEWFLREYFTVPAETNNPIFKNGYKNVSGDRFKSSSGALQIIPVLIDSGKDMYMPTFSSGDTWPTQTKASIMRFKRPMKKRVEKILMNISNYSSMEKILLKAGAKILINRRITKTILNAMCDSLATYDLIED